MGVGGFCRRKYLELAPKQDVLKVFEKKNFNIPPPSEGPPAG